MTNLTKLLLAALAIPVALQGADARRAANTVVLDDTGVKNLRIETVEVEETTFEETIFSLGRIEHIPIRAGAVSSRISGRVVDLKVSVGDHVQKGSEVARIESRQPGDPPPVISVVAPLSGLVTSTAMQLGKPVEPENSLLEITDLSEVYAVARVPEHQAGKMKPGTVAHIRVTALPDEKFDGELLRFGTAADAKSGTIDAIFRLPNPDLLLRPGMRGEFSIVLGKRDNVTSVPRSAIQGDAASRFVYVKDFDLKNAFVKTAVTVGSMNDRFGEILSGLLPGDEVVTQGSYSLAFAGGGSVSLKEALDAAHGHEHAADGSELKPEQKGAKGGEGGAHANEESGSGGGPLAMFSYTVNVILLFLLVVAMRRKPVADYPQVAAKKSEPKKEAA
ncbi:efflux RND transporter periplasmic adaptor subunit [Verrucomicrobium sp. BvORR034]|jgi:cobalt-zinc-cadmium efflux system membrane fusion protein|uniref:efflux RND transporter periplasmic adaptor subunit n=1 Tax=Verrucomicrobium sp. BvORR034 TaxID=1396418 RepID=UPI000678B566|nr:efflux RND transporter periplasmic adaptor subunit [Verrucomicrobium sp. BvORR034]